MVIIEKYPSYEVSLFKCCKSPQVERNVKINEVLREIKFGGPNLNYILEARKVAIAAYENKTNSPFYDKIKTTSINSFSPNASFKHKRNKKSIENLSGLIYLDIDGSTDIDLSNPYIYSTWLSLSGKGRGVLVKVNGIDNQNFSFAYNSIAEEINIDVDPHCTDLSRQVVISYDPNIFINDHSKTFSIGEFVSDKENKIPLTVPKKRKREECYLKGGNFLNKLRWDNLEDYDLQGKDYVIFDEIQYFSKAYIPETIGEGKRNSTINSTIHQLKALNPLLTKEHLFRLINILNSRCSPPLPPSEIEDMKRKLSKKLEEEDYFFELLPNCKRRVIFANSVCKKERQKIGAQVSGKVKKNYTIDMIQHCLDDWDLNEGRVTNEKIAKAIGRSKKTVDKYSPQFKSQKQIINKLIKEGK
jgi:hypothetical protein